MKSIRTHLQRRRLAALIAAGALGILAAGTATSAPMKPEEVSALFKKADANADGAVTKDELSAVDQSLSADFDKVDANKDGKLTLREFAALFG